MSKENSQNSKGKILHDLHHNGKLLILPNVWESLGAAMQEDKGYPADAPASGATAFSNGYQDDEKIPFNDLLVTLQRIKSNDLSGEKKFSQTMLSGMAYKDAGADGLYPIFLKDKKRSCDGYQRSEFTC